MADTPQTRPSRLRPVVDKTSTTIKRKMPPIRLDANNNVNTVKKELVPIFAVKKAGSMAVQKWNQTQNRPRLEYVPKPVNLYDASHMEQNMDSMDQDVKFEQFNQMTLNELCKTADDSPDLKFATQRFFEVMYTALKMDWLIDDGNDKFTLLQARRLLQCFGPFIATLIVNTAHLEKPEEKDELLELIDKHCHGILFWDTN